MWHEVCIAKSQERNVKLSVMLAIVTNAVSVLAYLLSTVLILRRHSRYLPLFGFVSLTQLWTLVSCFYNDLGIYNFELFRYTSVTFATSRLALFYVVFNIGFTLIAAILRHRVPVQRDYDLSSRPINVGGLKMIAYALIGLVLGYVLYRAAAAGIPILQGFDRLAYLHQATPVDRLVLAWGRLLAFVLGMTRVKRGMLSWNGAILLIVLIYAVAVGHKFSFLSDLLLAYWIPVFARRVATGRKSHSVKLKYFLYVGMFMFVSAWAAYSIYAQKLGSLAGARALLTNRALSFQGEMWWAVDNQVIDAGSHDAGHWLDELGYLTGPDTHPRESVGMRYLMVKVLGAQRAHAIFEVGYLYTMTYPAILVATFPYSVALIFQLLAGVLFCVLLFYLHFALVSDHKIRAIIAFLIIIPFIAMLWTGNFFVFFTVGVVVKILVLVTMESLPRFRLAKAGDLIRLRTAALTK